MRSLELKLSDLGLQMGNGRVELLGCIGLFHLHLVVQGIGSCCFVVIVSRILVVAGWLHIVGFFAEFVEDGVCNFFGGVALCEKTEAGSGWLS
jgi:hypothetical protein